MPSSRRSTLSAVFVDKRLCRISRNADFVLKTWNGQAEDPNFAAMDAAGDFNRLVIKSSGDVMVPDGGLDVMRSTYPATLSERVAEPQTVRKWISAR